MVREGTVLPVKDLDLSVRRELFSEARRLGGIAHAERDAPCLGAQEAPDDGSRCAAGAEQRHFPALRREIVLCERLHEADAVCVIASQVAIPIDNRVDRPDDAGVLIDSVELRHDGLLVRDRDVPAGKLHGPESRHRLLELIGRHGQRDVDVVEPRLFDGRILQHRRERVGNRPAHDAKILCRSFDHHKSSRRQPCARRVFVKRSILSS